MRHNDSVLANDSAGNGEGFLHHDKHHRRSFLLPQIRSPASSLLEASELDKQIEPLFSSELEDEKEMSKTNSDTKENSEKRSRSFEDRQALMLGLCPRANSKIYWIKELLLELIESVLKSNTHLNS